MFMPATLAVSGDEGSSPLQITVEPMRKNTYRLLGIEEEEAKRYNDEGNSGGSAEHENHSSHNINFGDTGETMDRHMPTLSNEYDVRDHSSSIQQRDRMLEGVAGSTAEMSLSEKNQNDRQINSSISKEEVVVKMGTIHQST